MAIRYSDRMVDRPDLSLILPAYNEVRRIADTIAEARAYFQGRGLGVEIIVAADGTDGTRELAAGMAGPDAAITVIGSAERRGKGLGVRQAVALARGEIVGFSDADNKTPITEFDKVKPLLDAGYDLVIGSRRSDGSLIERAQPLHRRLGSRGFGWLIRAVVGLRDIPDTQCGFKFFRQSVARDLFGRQTIDGYLFDIELLYLARRTGYRIAQVPVRWRDDGDSRLALLSGNVRNLIDLARIRLGT